MSPTKRRIHTSLIHRLRDEPYRFEFFQAVRLLLAQHRKQSLVQDKDVLGQVIMFRNSVSLGFPPSEIESLEFEWESNKLASLVDADEKTVSLETLSFSKVILTPSFMGLTGPMGVLPRHYTQHVAEREMFHRDTATRAFLDIFTSRAVALFYQAWLKYRLHFQYEADRRNKALPFVLSLAGLGWHKPLQKSAISSSRIPDEFFAYYAGMLRQRPQSAQWFARVASDYFGVQCKVTQFVGQWFDLPENELSSLGGMNNLLGKNTFCGNRVWDRQAKVLLTIGPLRKSQFDEFLPLGPAAEKLRHLFRLMVGVTFDCEVRLVLDRRDITAAAIRSVSSVPVDTRLGWNSWVASKEVTHHAQDTAYVMKHAAGL